MVNSTLDAPDIDPGDQIAADEAGNTTLRAAIMEANALPGADVITLPPGVYQITRPGAAEDEALTGDLDILEDVEIHGAGAGQTVIDGNQLDRVLEIFSKAETAITDVTIRRGHAPTQRGGAVQGFLGRLGDGVVQ